MGKAGQFFEQQVALVHQVRGLCILGLLFGELLVHQCQVGCELVDLGDRAVHGLPGFQVHQVQLARKLAETSSDAVRLAQEAATHDRGRGVARECACRLKKPVQGRAQAHAFAAHDVNHPVGVADHGLLAGQVTHSVAQVALNELVVLALDAIDHHARAQKDVARQGDRQRAELDVLPGVAIGGDVGNVIADRRQGLLVNRNRVAGNARHVTHNDVPSMTWGRQAVGWGAFAPGSAAATWLCQGQGAATCHGYRVFSTVPRYWLGPPGQACA